MVRSIAVLGAGHGGHAAAADLSLRGHEVRFYSRSREALQPVREMGWIELDGVAGTGRAAIASVTNDLEEAVSGADLIMLVVPRTAHEAYAQALAPLLAPGQPIFLNPGHTGGGLHFVAELRRSGYRGGVRTCEAAELTYGCRIQGPAHVRVMRVVPRMPFAAFPGKHAGDLHSLVSELYPMDLRKNVLETGFFNLNAVEHPPQALLNTGWLEHTRGNYYFYYEGTTPSVGRVIDALDRERLAIAAAMKIESKTFIEAFFEMGFTTENAVTVGTAYQALQESEPNRWIKGPASLDHRYVHEDVGFGLVPWAAWGAIAGVSTPTMDALISIASVVNDCDYLREGLTLERMGLSGLAIEDLDELLYEGERVSDSSRR